MNDPPSPRKRATLVATKTLEQLDWDTILDASPACENPAGCDHDAVNRIRWTCGCGDLACQPCTDKTTAGLAQMLLLGRTAYHCAACGRDLHARHLSDLLLIAQL